MIYLDNAATTLRKPPQVIDAVARAMGSFGNSARGTHEGALTASRTIYNTRCKLAALFGCPRPDHVVFTANSTEALNIAINGLVRAGDHVLSTDLEHNSVLRPLYRLRDERGVALDFVPADRQGRIDYTDLERLLRHTLKIRPAEEAAALRRRAEPGRVAADEPAVGAVRCTVLPARLLHCRPERHNLAMGRRSVVADDGIERLPARLPRGKHRCNARKAHTGSSWLKIVIF